MRYVHVSAQLVYGTKMYDTSDVPAPKHAKNTIYFCAEVLDAMMVRAGGYYPTMAEKVRCSVSQDRRILQFQGDGWQVAYTSADYNSAVRSHINELMERQQKGVKLSTREYSTLNIFVAEYPADIMLQLLLELRERANDGTL